MIFVSIINGYELDNKIFETLNFLIAYANIIMLDNIQLENREFVFHELAIISVFKRLICIRLETKNQAERTYHYEFLKML